MNTPRHSEIYLLIRQSSCRYDSSVSGYSNLPNAAMILPILCPCMHSFSLLPNGEYAASSRIIISASAALALLLSAPKLAFFLLLLHDELHRGLQKYPCPCARALPLGQQSIWTQQSLQCSNGLAISSPMHAFLPSSASSRNVPPTHPNSIAHGGHGPLPTGQRAIGGKEVVAFLVKSPISAKHQNIQFTKVVEGYQGPEELGWCEPP